MRNPRRHARRVRQDVNQILLREWDPIGVRNEPYAQDEYESYAPGVCRLPLNGASSEEIADHLLTIETESMGLSGGDPKRVRSHLTAVAESLKAVDLGKEF